MGCTHEGFGHYRVDHFQREKREFYARRREPKRVASALAAHGWRARSATVANFNEVKFQRLARKWMNDVRFQSSVRAMLTKEYLEIIGMGKTALPMILKHLNQTRAHWLIALCSISGEDPAEPNSTYREAVDAWLRWGRERGYLA